MALFAPPSEQATQDDVAMSSGSALSTRARKAIVKNAETHYIKAAALEALTGGIPAEGEQWRIVTEKQFNAFALVLSILETRTIEELHIAIYRINQPTVHSLIDFAERGMIKRGSFVISNFFNQTKKPEAWARRLREWCDESDRFEHVYIHNHAKVVALRTDRDEHLVFEGSGNMSDNARIEQYLYEQSRETFEFHREWMTDLIREDRER